MAWKKGVHDCGTSPYPFPMWVAPPRGQIKMFPQFSLICPLSLFIVFLIWVLQLSGELTLRGGILDPLCSQRGFRGNAQLERTRSITHEGEVSWTFLCSRGGESGETLRWRGQEAITRGEGSWTPLCAVRGQLPEPHVSFPAHLPLCLCNFKSPAKVCMVMALRNRFWVGSKNNRLV